MKSEVIEKHDRVYIDKIQRLEWGKNTDNSFIRSAQLVLNRLGENYSYEFIMGISGAAFRLHFHPKWCPSSADSTTGFDVSKVLFKSLGYKSELFSINDNSFNDIKSLYQKIIDQINKGIPIVAINLKVCPEWGIITGYTKDKPGILCRTYFDNTDEYSLAERAPWLTFFIHEKNKPMTNELLFINSLKLAVQLAKTEEFEIYKSGFSAFEKWIEELKKKSGSADKNRFKESDTNLTILDYLIDSRRAAAQYFEYYKKLNMIKSYDVISENYQKEFEILKNLRKDVLPSYDSKAKDWTTEIINKQIDVLTQVLAKEKETINLIENELNN